MPGLSLQDRISLFLNNLTCSAKASDILKWLYSGDITGRFEKIRNMRALNTGDWFLKEFKNWIEEFIKVDALSWRSYLPYLDSYVTLTLLAGAGKSFLTCYFYCFYSSNILDPLPSTIFSNPLSRSSPCTSFSTTRTFRIKLQRK